MFQVALAESCFALPVSLEVRGGKAFVGMNKLRRAHECEHFLNFIIYT